MSDKSRDIKKTTKSTKPRELWIKSMPKKKKQTIDIQYQKDVQKK